MMDMPLTNTEFAILGLLIEEPSHGYDLERKIEERGMRDWTEIGFSSIYFVLGKLEKKGCVTAEASARSGVRASAKSRKTFRATPEGIRIHKDQTFSSLAVPHPQYPSVLLGLANWPSLTDGEAQKALTMRLAALAKNLEQARNRQRDLAPLPDFVDAMFNYSIGQMEAEMSWVETMIEKERKTMSKVDFKKTLKPLYVPSAKEIVVVDVPGMNFLMVDGAGAPGSDNPDYERALSWLYGTSYGLKFLSKGTLDRDYVVPPLEGLWWAEDMSAFTADRKDEWLWTMMIMQPDWITDEMVEDCMTKAEKKLGERPASLRFEPFEEGLSAQILHVGAYSDEGPTIARMHNEFIPENGLVENGHHHEIYLNDPRKTAPEKLKTVLRQPVRHK